VIGLRLEKGQGLVEYALILVLIAVIVLAVLLILGPIIGNSFSEVNSEFESVSYVLQML
jgi:pilus assembly protein Flp/PilA